MNIANGRMRFALCVGLLISVAACEDRPANLADGAAVEQQVTPPTPTTLVVTETTDEPEVPTPPEPTTQPVEATTDESPPDELSSDETTSDESPTVEEGDPTWIATPGAEMPSYTAQRLDGAPIDLAELRGQPILLNFWATWCVPCRLEFAELSRLQERFGASGLQVVGVSLDDHLDGAALAEFAEVQGLNYTVLQDLDGGAAVFGVPPVPGNFVFDSEGRVTFSAVGAPEGSVEALVQAVEELMVE